MPKSFKFTKNCKDSSIDATEGTLRTEYNKFFIIITLIFPDRNIQKNFC